MPGGETLFCPRLYTDNGINIIDKYQSFTFITYFFSRFPTCSQSLEADLTDPETYKRLSASMTEPLCHGRAVVNEASDPSLSS